jgi:F-type H+-transporting ATPase subunit b
MDEIFKQLGTLLLGSVPTIVLFLLLLMIYRFLVYGPLMRVLGERRKRTEGAMEQANAATSAAAAKVQEYEGLLRAARGRIFEARQEKLQKWNLERDRALAEAHEAAQHQVTEARAALQTQIHTAQSAIETSVDELAGEILQAILPRDRATVGSTR